MSKLASTAWGAQASTLRTSALALCYSVAEHCCPVWSRSSHVSLVDSQLNHAMRLISGYVQPTQTPVAPILLLRLYVVGQPQTNCSVTSRPIQTGLSMRMCLTPTKRLVARRPIWADTTPVDQRAQWEEDWLSAAVVNSHLVCDPTNQQPGFDLPRHSWTLLNRFRTGQGPCRANNKHA